MPPQLALLLCTIFVVFLLRLDYKQATEVSHSLWIPTIWAFVAFSKPLGVWFGNIDQGSMEAGSPLDRVFLAILFCLAIIVLLKKKFDWSNATKENIFLFLLVGFMLISITWSSMPYISFKRWTRELIAVVMAFIILSEHNPRQALMSILRRITYVLIPYSLVLIKYYPKYGIDYGRWSGVRMWRGVATQKNGLTLLCVISALFLIWTLIRRQRGLDIPVAKLQTYVEVFLLILTIVLLMGPRMSFSYSATSTVVLVLAIISLSVLYWMKKRGSAPSVNALKAIIVIIVLYGTITPFLGRLSILDVSSSLKRDRTLTGRSEIWASLVPLALSRPVLGHGVGGFWTTEIRNLTSSNAHNGYLDAILDLGFLGLLLISIFLLSCCQKAYQAITYDFEWGILFICYLLIAATHNIAESSINSFTSPLTAIVVFFSASLLKVSGKENTLARVLPQSVSP